MNISDATRFVPLRGTTRSAATSAAAAQPRTAPAVPGDSRPTEVETRDGRLGSEVAERLDAAVEKLRGKLAELASKQDLSSDQIAQLREAEAHLQSTLERIHNALDQHGLAPSTLRLGFRSAVGEMQSAVQDVLAADETPGNGGGDGVQTIELDGGVVDLAQAGAVGAAERIDVGGDQAPADPVLTRLSYAEERMTARVDELLASPDLTDEQRAALNETREEFGATLDRLRNAMDGGVAPVTVARGFRVALSQFREGVDGALGSGEAGSTTETVVDPRTARRMEQLHHVGENIDQRLENLIARDGLGADQVAALEEARAGFQASLEELRGSLLNSDLDVRDVRSAFMEALEGLVDEVHGALNEEGPTPLLYTAADGVDVLGDRDQGSALDQRA